MNDVKMTLMKTCRTCNRIYTDESYSFCLEDGTLLSVSSDPQATIAFPGPSDNTAPSVLTVVPSNLAPTVQFQPKEPSQADIIQRLLNYLKDGRQNFSILGGFRYNNEYIWTNGHFFEIAESLPTVLMDLFPLKDGSSAVELVKSLETQLSTYKLVQSIIPSKKEGMIDLVSDKQIIHVNNVYFQYLQIRYPKAAIMTGVSSYNPALFVLDGKLQAGVMGVKL